MREAFWEGKKVLVTGHTGFKGSWLSLWLQGLEADVVGFALEPPTVPSLFEMASVVDGMVSIIGDVRDPGSLESVFAEHRPEILFHLAAQPLVRYSYQNPVQTYTTNVVGTLNVLESVRRAECVRAAVFITSDKCYLNREWLWGYRENERLGGQDPYSSSKACAELVISAYRDSYFQAQVNERPGVAVASARAGNVIGGGDWARDRLIPDVMKSIMGGRPVIVRSPGATRPWQHVLDPLHGYLRLAEELWESGPDFAQAWNFGPSSEEAKSVSWIAEYLTRSWGEGARWELDSGQHPHENTYLRLDCSKARDLLGWAPRLRVSAALDWIVEWYRELELGRNIRSVTQNQIGRFEDLESA